MNHRSHSGLSLPPTGQPSWLVNPPTLHILVVVVGKSPCFAIAIRSDPDWNPEPGFPPRIPWPFVEIPVTQVGSSRPERTIASVSVVPECLPDSALYPAAPLCFESPAVVVGNNPDTVPLVRSANGGSGYTIPERVIPDLSEAPENRVQSARAKGCNVFADDPCREGVRDDPEHLVPKTTTDSGETSASASEADILTREAPCDDVNVSDQKSHEVPGQLAHIPENRHPGKVMGEDGAAESFPLAHPDDFVPCSLESKLEPSDATEEAQDFHLRYRPPDQASTVIGNPAAQAGAFSVSSSTSRGVNPASTGTSTTTSS